MPAPNWKEPRAINRLAKQRTTKSDDERARTAVRKRDQYRCRLCGRKTSVVHEHKRRGAGGIVSLTNSFVLCSGEDGGFCHDLVGTRWIYPVMTDGAEIFNASRAIDFEMSPSTARRVFGDRTPPAHVRITEVK